MAIAVRRHIPIRSCVVCRQTSDKRALLRVVRLPEKDGSRVVADPTGKKAGRGAYICPDAACIDKALKGRRFERSLGKTAGAVDPDLYDILRAQAAEAKPPPSTTPADEAAPMN